MTGSTIRLLAGLAIAAMACAAAAEPPIVVGAVVSRTGAHAEMAAPYARGLQLWGEQVNAGGGLLGRPVELRLLDDGSEAVRNSALYVELIRKDKADLLIGPYGTAATLMGAAEAESARRVMVTGAAPSRAVHKRSPRFVFQAGIPYANYGEGPLALAEAHGYRNVFLVARDDPVAREMAEAAKEKALKLGLAASDVELYQAGADDFGPLVLKARAMQADAWVAFGEVRDAGEMLKSLKKLGYAPRLFFCRDASDPVLLKRVGQDAEFAIGALAYDARLGTAGNARFVRDYEKRFSVAPDLAAAEGYAAGTVLAEGVKRAGSLDQAKVRSALAALTTETVLGPYKVDPATGEQLAASPPLAQVRLGRERVVWPASLAAEQPALPYPQWGERKILK